ncbi:hypothetical protein B484DRAFT_39610 [Ochromonadaceae sp. CCMP2298]|nr:hypothetical protein B484DRAFT_39610 [Ochromonadaceae sp. CCMP2298]
MLKLPGHPAKPRRWHWLSSKPEGEEWNAIRSFLINQYRTDSSSSSSSSSSRSSSSSSSSSNRSSAHEKRPRPRVTTLTMGKKPYRSTVQTLTVPAAAPIPAPAPVLAALPVHTLAQTLYPMLAPVHIPLAPNAHTPASGISTQLLVASSKPHFYMPVERMGKTRQHYCKVSVLAALQEFFPKCAHKGLWGQLRQLLPGAVDSNMTECIQEEI